MPSKEVASRWEQAALRVLARVANNAGSLEAFASLFKLGGDVAWLFLAAFYTQSLLSFLPAWLQVGLFIRVGFSVWTRRRRSQRGGGGGKG